MVEIIAETFEWIGPFNPTFDATLVTHAHYDPHTFGSSGHKLRGAYCASLLEQYVSILKEQFQINPEEKWKKLKQKGITKTYDETLLYQTLTYLIPVNAEAKKNSIVKEVFEPLVDDESRYWNFASSHDTLLSCCAKTSTEVMEMGRLFAYVRMIPRIGLAQKRLVHAYYQCLPEMTPQTFSKIFAIRNRVFQNVRNQTKFNAFCCYWIKFSGEFSLSNYFGQNPPHLEKIETLEDREGHLKTIYDLRHPTPHNQACVSAVYKNFLQVACERNEGVLYCVHQRLSDLSGPLWNLFGFSRSQNEEYRVHSILGLEKEHPNLLVLVQSVENHLFVNGLETFEELKNGLIDSFRQKEGSCRNRLPHYLIKDEGAKRFKIDEEYEKELREILDFVHSTFFGKKRTHFSKEQVNCYGEEIENKHLTNECQAFIMLFYHFQREHLKCRDLRKNHYRFQVAFVASGCKDSNDRTGAHNLIRDRVHHHQVYGNHVPKEDLEAAAYHRQAPAIHAKGSALLAHRLHVALFVSNLLATLTEAQFQAVQTVRWAGGWRMKEYQMV